MTTGKTIALTRGTFVGKVTSLLFNMLSRLVIAFLPRGKHCLISWLQSPSAVTLEPPKIKSLTVSIIFPSICHEVMGPDVMRPKCQVSIRPKCQGAKCSIWSHPFLLKSNGEFPFTFNTCIAHCCEEQYTCHLKFCSPTEAELYT